MLNGQHIPSSSPYTVSKQNAAQDPVEFPKGIRAVARKFDWLVGIFPTAPITLCRLTLEVDAQNALIV